MLVTFEVMLEVVLEVTFEVNDSATDTIMGSGIDSTGCGTSVVDFENTAWI